MKLLTKEEEDAHYSATLKGGIGGGLIGTTVGLAAVYGASVRYPAFRSLTLPLRAFLVTSAGTFSAIVSADKYSREFEKRRHPEQSYKDDSASALDEARARQSLSERLFSWGKENRYPIVTASWVASMGTAFALVGRNPYLSGTQKLVQARVYAQGLTLAVLIATAAFETNDARQGKGRWETVKILDPNDPEHKKLIEKRIHHESYAGEDLWRDMVDTEEKRLKSRDREIAREEAQKGKGKGKKHDSTNTKDSANHAASSSSSSSASSTKGDGGKAEDDGGKADDHDDNASKEKEESGSSPPAKPTAASKPKTIGKDAAQSGKMGSGQGQDGTKGGQSGGAKQSGKKQDIKDKTAQTKTKGEQMPSGQEGKNETMKRQGK